MKKIILGIPTLLLVGIAVAEIILTGMAISQVTMPLWISLGQRKIGETVERVLGIVNQTISDSFNLTVVCLGRDSILLTLKTPLPVRNIPLDLNGTTVITKPDDATTYINPGNLTLIISHIKQGAYNCTIQPLVTNNTIIQWVEEL